MIEILWVLTGIIFTTGRYVVGPWLGAHREYLLRNPKLDMILFYTFGPNFVIFIALTGAILERHL